MITEPDTPYFWQVGTACVEGGGSVRVTGAEFVNPVGGIRLTSVALRPIPDHVTLGEGKGTLAGRGYVSRVTDEPCKRHYGPSEAPWVLVAVQTMRPDNGQVAMADAVRVFYDDGGVMEVPTSIVMCPLENRESEQCS